MFEPTSNLLSRYVSTVESKRRYHSSQVCVDVAGRDSFRFNCLYTDVAKTSNKQFSLSRNLFLLQTPTSQDHFAASVATLTRFFHVEIF